MKRTKQYNINESVGGTELFPCNIKKHPDKLTSGKRNKNDVSLGILFTLAHHSVPGQCWRGMAEWLMYLLETSIRLRSSSSRLRLCPPSVSLEAALYSSVAPKDRPPSKLRDGVKDERGNQMWTCDSVMLPCLACIVLAYEGLGRRDDVRTTRRTPLVHSQHGGCLKGEVRARDTTAGAAEGPLENAVSRRSLLPSPPPPPVRLLDAGNKG
ncbi:hypothetical protein O3P69_008009 [Scylla paramamosain]|uniref:Uncharacterized protein n=1 Tax=Scylla paramamosain TaxID=85552 RepID=A0AAW0T039_SCYPA